MEKIYKKIEIINNNKEKYINNYKTAAENNKKEMDRLSLEREFGMIQTKNIINTLKKPLNIIIDIIALVGIIGIKFMGLKFIIEKIIMILIAACAAILNIISIRKHNDINLRDFYPEPPKLIPTEERGLISDFCKNENQISAEVYPNFIILRNTETNRTMNLSRDWQIYNCDENRFVLNIDDLKVYYG